MVVAGCSPCNGELKVVVDVRWRLLPSKKLARGSPLSKRNH